MKKSDWELFQATLDKLDPMIPQGDGEDLDVSAESFDRCMRVALDVACPMKPALPKKPNTWWNPELERLRDEVRELAKRQSYGPDSREAFAAKRREYSRVIVEAKRESWRNFCSQAKDPNDLSRLVKSLDRATSSKVSLLSEDGVTLPPNQTLNHLLRAHFPEGQLDNRPLSILQPGEVDMTGVAQFISPLVVVSAIESFGDTKAAGPDGFAPLVLKKLTPVYYERLAEMFRVSLATGTIPRIWREMKLVFIPKIGKPTYDSPKSYRPITLSNFILKTLERLVQWFINM